MSINDPFKNSMGDFTHVDRSIPGSIDKGNVVYNETISALRKAGQEKCADALMSLTSDQIIEVDTVLNSTGSEWSLFSGVEYVNPEDVVGKLELFKNTEEKTERRKIILELVGLLGV